MSSQIYSYFTFSPHQLDQLHNFIYQQSVADRTILEGDADVVTSFPLSSRFCCATASEVSRLEMVQSQIAVRKI